MAMKLRVREIAEKQGIKNALQLRTLTGLGMGSCYQLWNGTATMISLDTLNTLCNTLQAGPALLLEYTPDVGQVDAGPGEAEAKPDKRERRTKAESNKGRKSQTSPVRAAVTMG
jgi:DNA-binding Xre family transcriptional regulator